MGKNNYRPTVGGDMVLCPYCHAYSYPRVFKEPKDETESKAVICGSCKTDLRPYADAMQKYEAKMKETVNETPTSDTALIMEGDSGTEVYVDSDKVAMKVLTEIEANSTVSLSPVSDSITSAGDSR
jgi:7-cyano-7-deazaguanine synthase in queuosine biosynthesis